MEDELSPGITMLIPHIKPHRRYHHALGSISIVLSDFKYDKNAKKMIRLMVKNDQDPFVGVLLLTLSNREGQVPTINPTKRHITRVDKELKRASTTRASARKPVAHPIANGINRL